MCRVDARCLSVRLTDCALSFDLFPAAYHRTSSDDVDDDERPQRVLPVKWMALELLDAIDDQRTVVYEPAADVVSWRYSEHYCSNSLSHAGVSVCDGALRKRKTA